MNHSSPFRDTIYALSSGALPSGVAVIRLSGPQTTAAISALAGTIPPPRRAVLRALHNVEGEILDQGLVIFFPAPASFTGEDCVEFQIHGGRAAVSSVLRALSKVPGLRQAEAGEFTRRAFINGKVDLTGAEALADLIAADTESQRRLAIENASGRQKQLYDNWRNQLLRARALLEAELDFSDEDDVPEEVSKGVIVMLQSMAHEIQTHLDGFGAAEIIRDGYHVVLVGAPNVGKSSLLNALAKREVAIVTDIPGTTRDLIEVALDLNGIKVVMADTAGIRETDDKVEKIGVERAIAAAEQANLILHLSDDNSKLPETKIDLETTPCLMIATKADLNIQNFSDNQFDHEISVITGQGLELLIKDIGSRAQAAIGVSSGTIPTRLRHVELLQSTLSKITHAMEEQEIELQAEQLRLASTSLGKITGTVDVEELLGVIFSEFCIGK